MKSARPTELGDLPPAWLHAHRGASADAPENTLAAFRLGLADGADGIELDIHLTADGVPVVIHDDLLERTTDRFGPIAALLAAEIAGADCRARWIGGSEVRAKSATAWSASETRVPAFSEILEWLPPDRGLVVDVKDAAAVEPVVRLLDAGRRQARAATRVIAFLPDAIDRVQELAPWLSTGLLIDEGDDLDAGLARARAGGHASLVPWSDDLGSGAALRDAIRRVRAAGLQIGVYTVNDPGRALELRNAGIAFLMSDVPGQIAKAMSS